MKILELAAKYKITIGGVGIGSALGWAYWYFVGCASGTCAITASPINSTLYGMLLGGLIANNFELKNKIK